MKYKKIILPGIFLTLLSCQNNEELNKVIKPITQRIDGEQQGMLTLVDGSTSIYYDELSKRINTEVSIKAQKQDTTARVVELKMGLLDKSKKPLIWLSRLDNKKVAKSLQEGKGTYEVVFSSIEFHERDREKLETIFKNVDGFEIIYNKL